MPKTIRNCYYRKLTFDNLYNAYIRASLNKRNKRSVIKFSVDLETYLSNIYNELYNNSYKSSKYREFIIYEPKKRIIKLYLLETGLFINGILKSLLNLMLCLDSLLIHMLVLLEKVHIRLF